MCEDENDRVLANAVSGKTSPDDKTAEAKSRNSDRRNNDLRDEIHRFGRSEFSVGTENKETG